MVPSLWAVQSVPLVSHKAERRDSLKTGPVDLAIDTRELVMTTNRMRAVKAWLARGIVAGEAVGVHVWLARRGLLSRRLSEPHDEPRQKSHTSTTCRFVMFSVGTIQPIGAP